jgi:phytoene dehydrogenase-like protein
VEPLDAIVVGAGPAGLGAALELARGGARVAVVEARDRPGGLCVTVGRAGYRYDLGGHIPFVRDEARRAWLADLLGADLIDVERPVSCVRGGRIVRGRYLDQRPDAPERTLPRDGTARGELAARFGAPFVDRVMRRYLEKVDGLPLERIPGERARRLLEDQAAPDGFPYPRHGIGQLMDRMADEARAAGAELLLSTGVSAIRVPKGRMAGVVLAGLEGSRELAAAHAVIALPAGPAARMLDPAPPASTTRALRMRAVALVFLTVAGGRLTEEPWVQVDDPLVPFARAFEPANWSPDLTPPGAGLVGLECYCQAETDDPVWGLDDDDLAAACAEAIAGRLGWIADPDALAPLEVIRLPAAYPMADLEQIGAMRAPALWLDGLQGVHLVAGSAVIEAIEAGERAARAILTGREETAVDPEAVPPIS